MIRTLIILLFFFNYSYSQELKRFDCSECMSDSIDIKYSNLIQTRIIDSTYNKSSLTILVGIWANCGYEYVIGRIKSNNKNLYLIADRTKYDTIVDGVDTVYEEIFQEFACECYFNFEFYIENIPNKYDTIFFNGKKIDYKATKYDMTPKDFKISANGDTTNVINAFGIKEGLWITYTKKGKIEQEIFYENNKAKNGQYYLYDKENNLKKTIILENFKIIKEIKNTPNKL